MDGLADGHERQMDRQTHRQITDRTTDSCTARQLIRWTDGQMGRRTDVQKDRWAHGLTDK